MAKVRLGGEHSDQPSVDGAIHTRLICPNNLQSMSIGVDADLTHEISGSNLEITLEPNEALDLIAHLAHAMKQYNQHRQRTVKLPHSNAFEMIQQLSNASITPFDLFECIIDLAKACGERTMGTCSEIPG